MLKLFYATLLVGSINLTGPSPERVDEVLSQSNIVRKTNLDSAYLLTTIAYEIAEKCDYTLGKAKTRFLQGFILKKENEMSKAMIMYLKGIEIVRSESEDEFKDLHISMLANAGTILEDHFHYDKALEFYLEAERLSYENQINKYLTNIHYKKGKLYKNSGKLYEAYESAKEMLSLATRDENETMIGRAYNLLGLTARNNAQYDLARQYFDSLIAYDFKKSKILWLGRANHNIGTVYLEQGNYDSAAMAYRTALQYKLEKNSPKDLYITYLDLTEVYLNKGELDVARQMGQAAEDLYVKVTLKEEHYRLFSLLKDVCFKSSEYELGIRYVEKFEEESHRFVTRQNEVLEQKEQFKMDLILAGFYQEIEIKNERAALISNLWFAGIILVIFFFFLGDRFNFWRLRTTIQKDLEDNGLLEKLD